jgi:hypothetical protein
MAGTAATAVAIGSLAWYYHLYGSELYAMTPTEEGLVYMMGLQLLWTGHLIPNRAGAIENLN